METIVIIGAGMAAYGLARELRKLDQTSRLLIVTADSGSAYAKPMLSNAYAQGKGASELRAQTARQMADQLKAEVLTATRITAIDSAARRVTTHDASFAYSKLVLAVGAAPIRLPIAGDAAEAILSVNHIDDYALLRERLDAHGGPARVAILGAGLIGCEFADDLAGAGHHVTLIDPNPLPLAALAAPALSQGLARAWSGRSIALRLGTTAAAAHRTDDGGVALTLADGSGVQADLVLSAVGLRPALALAQAAGLATRRGIVVDAYGRTSDPDIYALGDCAEYATDSGSAVLPYVAPLMTAARAIAATLAGTPTPIALKPDAVIVKTPSYKLALSPPPPGSDGQWVHETDDERTVARYLDADGVLRGFGLSAHTPALRASLLSALGSAPA